MRGVKGAAHQAAPVASPVSGPGAAIGPERTFGVTLGAHVEFAQVRNVASAVAVNSEREQQAVDHRVDTEQKARR